MVYSAPFFRKVKRKVKKKYAALFVLVILVSSLLIEIPPALAAGFLRHGDTGAGSAANASLAAGKPEQYATIDFSHGSQTITVSGFQHPPGHTIFGVLIKMDYGSVGNLVNDVVTLSYSVNGVPGPTTKTFIPRTSYVRGSGNFKTLTLDITRDRAWTADDIRRLAITLTSSNVSGADTAELDVDELYLGTNSINNGINSSPFASNLIVSPASPVDNNNLIGSYDFTDPDGDFEIGTEIRWYQNGVLVPALNNTLTVPNSSTQINDQWYFTVKPCDGDLAACGALQTSPTVTILPIPNRPPVLSPVGNQAATENVLLTIDVNATDLDNDTLAYGVSGFPSGATFDTVTGVLSWTPSYFEAGKYLVSFSVVDGRGGTDSETIIITVSSVNRPPVLDPVGNKDGNEGALLTFTLTGEDPDSDPVSFTSTALPSGAEFNGSTGVFSWTPDFTQEGTYSVTFTATDGSLTDSETVEITIAHTNQPPVLAPVGNRAGSEGMLLEIQLSGSDADNDQLTFEALGIPSEGSTFNAATGLLHWTPDFMQEGTYSVTFIATDGNLTDSETVEITIAHTNQPPVLNPVGNRAISESGFLEIQLAATDADNDPVIYSITGGPQGYVFNQATGLFQWTPDPDQSGNYDLTFGVTDGFASDSEAMVISVGNVNRPPELAPIGAKAGSENSLLEFTITASDPDSDPVTLATAELPVGANFDSATGVFSWTPDFTQERTYSVTFTATDGSLTDSETVEITIAHTNQPPVLAPVGNRAGSEGMLLEIQLSGSDADNDQLTFEALGIPSEGSTFNAATGLLHWTPDFIQSGSFGVTFGVNDGVANDTESIVITVNNVNRAPVLDPIGEKRGNENNLLEFSVTASDPDLDPVILGVTDLPAGASFNAETGVFSWTPDFTQEGVYAVTFSATDNGELVDTEIVAITISGTNEPPVLAPVGDKTVDENNLLTFTINATDGDEDTIVYSATNLPEGATLNAGTGVFSWTPNFTQENVYSDIVFVATSGDPAQTDSEAVTITVNHLNGPSVLGSIGNQMVNHGSSLSFTLSARDPDSDPISFSADTLPSGATLDTLTGAFTWSSAVTGTYMVMFTATSGAEPQTDSETVTITVNPPPPPSNTGGGSSGGGRIVTPPVITNLTVSITPAAVVINWDTNEPATTFVDFGMTNTYGQSAAPGDGGSLILKHAVSIPMSLLRTNTIYHFRAVSADSFGDIGYSGDQQFTTGARVAPPVSPVSPTGGNPPVPPSSTATTAPPLSPEPASSSTIPIVATAAPAPSTTGTPNITGPTTVTVTAPDEVPVVIDEEEAPSSPETLGAPDLQASVLGAGKIGGGLWWNDFVYYLWWILLLVALYLIHRKYRQYRKEKKERGEW